MTELQVEGQERFDDSVGYLEFSLAGRVFALALENVREVIPLQHTTDIPNGPNYFRGIMNLRGKIITVMNLGTRLGVPQKERENDKDVPVVICEVEDLVIGLVVDAIDHVVNYSPSQIVDIPEIKSQVRSEFVLGVVDTEGKGLSVILDLYHLFGINAEKGMAA